MQLLCFTCAGGTADFFDPLESCICSDVNVIKLEYAGHGSRHREKFYSDFSELAEDMYKQLRLVYKKGEAYAMLGYSMGCISVIETLKLILKFGKIEPPAHIFLAAHAPYARKELEGFHEKISDDWICKRTVLFGGIPKELIDSRIFWRVYLPVYRADYLMISKYDFQQINLRSEIPATVFYSETDTSYAKVIAWRHFFVGKCELICYEGDHFFIKGHEQELADVIMRDLGIESKN